ncbi:MAG: c-type cytochrome [bacterium]|nr:c-type cytochrome [bacterium]
MKRFPFLIGAVLPLALVFSFASTAASEEVEIRQAPVTWTQAALSDGEELYGQLCASCHGMDATGNGPAAPALAMPVPDLTRLALDNDGEFPTEGVEKSIQGGGKIVAHGSVEMPVWGRVLGDVRPDFKPYRREAFAKQQIFNLTEYLKSIQVEED